MTDRTRRGFLALSASALAAVAGCTDGRAYGDGPGKGGAPGGDATDTDETTPTDRGTGTDAGVGTTTDSALDAASLAFDRAAELRRADAPVPQRDVASYYLALLRSADDASAFPTDRFGNDDAAAFVAETDFASETVVVLQDRRGSSVPDLELVGAGLSGATLAVEARYPGQGGTADVTTDTLLVRAATGDRAVRAARATVRPQSGDPVRFATANAYDVTPEFDPAGDLVVRNRDCAERRPGVTVTYSGDLFLEESPTLGPASTRRFEGVFSLPGEWTVSARSGDRTVSETVPLTDAPPGDVLVEAGGDGSVSIERRPEGVESGATDRCETDGGPYESPDPGENVADPVDLWVLDRSPEARELTVGIRDGDREVFSETFDTSAGDDKAHRADLLAKRATYVVEVRAAAGASVTETVTVDDGVSKLTVRVTEAGELAVSVD